MYLAIRSVHEQQGFSVKLLCEVARLERSSYYKWVNHKPSPQEQENEQLLQEMLSLHEKVRGIYGYRRHTVQLSRDTNKPINHKRILRLMRLQGFSRSSAGRKSSTCARPHSTSLRTCSTAISRLTHQMKSG
ncbi:hypothetical protein C8Z91_07545 [Paenibacillus elgii]|uniref:HTH-like domain-containing protein n=1 Tax=Paenibacillus elgii TaxID=189691 RepID=A0A2T6G6X5_9BACL|nr:hypothetical protein C8Z91_07545 [Paenibacillus elgii]